MNRHAVALVIFILAFALRLGLFLLIQPWHQDAAEHQIIVDDAVSYHRLGVNLLEAGVYSNAEGPPYARHMYRTPMYPFFLTAVYSVFGIKAYAAVLVQMIMSAGMCVVLYRLGIMLFDPVAARIAALLLAVDHSQIVYANQLLSETLFTCLFLLGIYWFFSFLLKQRIRYLIYAGFYLGFSVLCRPVALYYIVIAAAVLLIWFRDQVKTALTGTALYTAVLLLSLAPWLARNCALSGGGVFVSEMEGVALSWYTESIRERLYGSDGPAQAPEQESGEAPDEENMKQAGRVRLLPVLARESLEYTGKVLLFFIMPAGGENVYARMLQVEQRQWDRDHFIEKPMQLLSDALHGMPLRQWAVIVFSTGWMVFINAAVLAGVRYGLRSEDRRIIQVLSVIILYFALVTGAAFAARFRIPVMPYLVLLAGAGLSGRYKNGTRPLSREAPAD